ncbi:MAG: RNA-binding domain-containing protein [Phormidesmis sp.]
MIFNIQNQRLVDLVHELCKQPKEAEWIEFKVNNANPQEIGEYISALANTATLMGRPRAYLIWGITDQTHELVGTQFVPSTAKKGNEELESWLLRIKD